MYLYTVLCWVITRRVVVISKSQENSSQLLRGGCLKTHIYTLLSHPRGRRGHQNFQKYLEYMVVTKKQYYCKCVIQYTNS